ncbi:hypothetical protein [Prevotella disiens]|uniref:hypothetical protein n=1 Tax=Prevotella disiens TaxID=28130 RepID=UPI00242BFFD7|nr:hypothetical protein [Prevotella disiens]
MGKKYRLLENDTITVNGRTLYRIEALRDFTEDVKKGDKGGYVEKEENLSHEGECWVYGNACVYDDAKVSGDAWTTDNAQVYGNACVYDRASVTGNACVYDNAQVYGFSDIFGYAHVFGYAKVFGRALVYGKAHVRGKTKLKGKEERS